MWKALRSTGVPDFLIDLIAALHENTGAQVRSGNNLSNRFQATSGVKQGCILVPALFLFAIDWVLNHMSTKPGICVGTHQFNDLVYADDTTFFVSYASHAVECLSSFNKSSSVLGMRVSWAKTKLQNMGSDGHGHTSNITVNGNTVDSTVFPFTAVTAVTAVNLLHGVEQVYGSTQSSTGGSQADITSRIALVSSVVSSLPTSPVSLTDTASSLISTPTTLSCT